MRASSIMIVSSPHPSLCRRLFTTHGEIESRGRRGILREIAHPVAVASIAGDDIHVPDLVQLPRTTRRLARNNRL
jgi:hypothetical protein